MCLDTYVPIEPEVHTVKSAEQVVDERDSSPRGSHWWASVGNQVLVSILVGIAVGALFPGFSSKLKIVGDVFLDLIQVSVAPLVFLTLVLGIAAAGDLRRASRTGLLALIYFEV